MAGQFIRSIKYGILAVIAFFGPKILTESGRYCAKMEKTFPTACDETPDSPGEKPIELPERPPLWSRIFHPTKESSEEKDRKTAYPVSENEQPARGYPSYSARYPSESPAPPILTTPAGIPVTPPEKIFRFDVTPDAVRAAWPKVYVDHSLPDLTGFRVSALTGTEADDLTGALTYYFDSRELRRIVFMGRTGDARRIIDFFAYRFGTVYQGAESNSETEVYRVPPEGWNKKANSSHLTIRRGVAYGAGETNGGDEVVIELLSED